jgi:hypothetical protein
MASFFETSLKELIKLVESQMTLLKKKGGKKIDVSLSEKLDITLLIRSRSSVSSSSVVSAIRSI